MEFKKNANSLKKNGSHVGIDIPWLPPEQEILILVNIGYSAGVITTSILLPALISWRAKAAMVSGVCALTRS